jgi:hypothetical protein
MNHKLIIILAGLALILFGALLFRFKIKRKKLRRFYEDLGLHSEIRKTVSGADHKRRVFNEIIYPKYKWVSGNLRLFNHNHSKTTDYLDSKREAFSQFFKKEFFKVEPHKKSGVVFVASKLPDEFIITDSVPKQLPPLMIPDGYDDEGKLHLFPLMNQDGTVPNGNKLITGRAGSGKSSLAFTFLYILAKQSPIQFIVLAPKNSFLEYQRKFNWDLKYFDSSKKDDIEAYIQEIKTHKSEIESVKATIKEKNGSDEKFLSFVKENKISYRLRLYLIDDGSTFLRSDLYQKDDELKAPINDLIRELNLAGRLYRFAFFPIWVISHSAKVEEVGISPIVYNSKIMNKVENEAVSRSIIGTNDLISPRLGRSCFYDVEKRVFLRTPFIDLNKVGGAT